MTKPQSKGQKMMGLVDKLGEVWERINTGCSYLGDGTKEELDSTYAKLQAIADSLDWISDEMLDRIETALQRHINNHAPMQIPANKADSDILLREIQMYRKGEKPRPFGK